MVATDYRTLTKHEEGPNDVSYLAGEALLDLTPETHDQKKIACTSLNDVSLLTTDAADATISDDKSEQHSDADLDREIDRALAEIRQDASLTEEESETSAGSSTESSLSNAFDKSPTNSAVDAGNSVNEADGCEKTDTGEMSRKVTIMDALRYLEKQKKLIRVMLTLSPESMLPEESTSFLVPASLVAQREQEMLTLASANCIAESVWSGSLLGRKCLALVGDIALRAAGDDDDYFSCASNDEDDVEDATSTEENTYTFVLDDPSSSGTDLAWTPALVDAIRSYYTLGSVSVSDDCDGRDILLILDHFGVVYRTEQLVHQSFAVHLRVKLWSEYFAARGQLAEWVTKTIMNGRSKLSYSFVTSPDTDDGAIFVGAKKTEVFDGGLVEDGEIMSSTIVHDLFVDESSLDGDSTDTTDRIDTLIRRDFCNYLLGRLPGCRISFDLCTDGVGGPYREAGVNFESTPNSIRAVLHLDFSGRIIQKETNKAPVNKVSEVAACQTAIRTLDDGGDEENEDQIHPNLAAAPTVVDLHEEETLDVHLRQVNSGDDCDNKSTVSALSSIGDGGSVLASVVEEDEAARQGAPLPPPLPESANVNINASVLNHPTSEKYEVLQVAQDPPSRKAEVDCVTIEDLNSQWLLDFINPFATFVEETLQAFDSNSIANVESVLWSTLSIPEFSSTPDNLHSDNESLPTPLRDATVDSVCPPAKREARLHSHVEEKKMPKEAGIEVRPLKTRSVDARPPISNACNAPTPLASNGFSSALTAISAVDIDGKAGSKQAKSIGESTKKMRRAKSIKTVFSKKKSKKFYT